MKDQGTQKQVFWFTVINYVGIVIGLISTIFVYPHNKEFLGIIGYVNAISQMLFPMMVFGGAQALIHFYPVLNEQHQKQLFKYGMATIVGIGAVLFVVLLVVKESFHIKNDQYLFYAFPIAFSLAFVELFKRQAANLQKIAVPTFYERIIPKLALPFLFLLLLFDFFNETKALIAYVTVHILLFGLLAFYVFKIYKVSLNFNFKSLFQQISQKQYYNYSFFAFLGSLGSFLAFRIDALMIPQFLTFENNGTYTIGLNLASALMVPAAGMFSIYAPLVSKYIKEDNMLELGKKYKEVATLLLFVGAVLYSSVVLGIDSFFHLMPTYNKLADSIPVIIVLGLNVVVNMATGLNNEVISFSKYYRFNILSVVFLAVLNIVLNYYFLTYTSLGIVGVACASLISTVLFNTVKVIFIYVKFALLPFDVKYFRLLGVVLAVSVLVYFIPSTAMYSLDLFIKTGLNITVSVLLVYKFRLVYALNYWVDKVLKINSDKQAH